MASKEIKQHIRSITNTKQITKAMEVVSATKMRRSQELALGLRPFALGAFRILQTIQLPETLPTPAMMQTRPAQRTLLVIITSDKGLAGSFNSNVLKTAHNWLQTQSQRRPTDVVTVGKKAKEYCAHRNYNVIKEFIGAGDFGAFDEVAEITEYLKNKFTEQTIDEVYAVYTNFKSTLRQEVVMRQLLPLKREYIREVVEGILPETGRYAEQKSKNMEYGTTERWPLAVTEYKFEPSAESVLEALAPYLFQLAIYHSILESNASEHSARMLAMKKASDNAAEIIDDLTLVYNKSRQASITQELIEITSGIQN